MNVTELKLAVLIVNYRTPALAIKCVEALAEERAALPKLMVVLVDGGSGDASAAKLATFAERADVRDWVEVLPLAINGGFGWANNQAILRLLAQPHAPEFIHLLNPDTQIEPGAVVALLDDLLRHPRTGATGSQLLDDDGQPSAGAFHFPSLRHELARGARTGLVERLLSIRSMALPTAAHRSDVDWVTGASVMFRTEALREVGLFDDGFFLYHEELELIWRLRRAGWAIGHEPRSRVRHVGGAATGVHGRVDANRSVPRRPAYWYQSRRLYFVRTQGKLVATAAALAWLFGHAIWRIRRLVGQARDAQPVSSELRDQLRYGFAQILDSHGGPVRWDSPVDLPPAWMSARRDD